MRDEILLSLISNVSVDFEAKAEKLINKYGSFFAVAEAEADDIAEVLGGDKALALYIKLSAALASRRGCDLFKFGKKHSEKEIEEYLKYLFFGLSVETVYLLSFDSSGKVLFCDRAGEGTVNISSVLPRKILEIAKKRRAAGVIIAHNHPGGYAKASDDDISATEMLRELLYFSGIELSAHYVVAGAECAKIAGRVK